MASDLVSPPARASQQAPSSQSKSDPRKTPASQKAGSGDFSPNDSRGGKTPLSLDEQGISSLDEAVGPSAEKQAIRRDPAAVSDESLLMHPSESSACDETACEASLGIDAVEAVTFASVYNASLGLLARREHSAGDWGKAEAEVSGWRDSSRWSRTVAGGRLQNDEALLRCSFDTKRTRAKVPPRLGISCALNQWMGQ